MVEIQKTFKKKFKNTHGNPVISLDTVEKEYE